MPTVGVAAGVVAMPTVGVAAGVVAMPTVGVAGGMMLFSLYVASNQIGFDW